MDVAGVHAELTGTVLLPGLLSAAIQLLGTVACPASSEVAAALARLEPAEAAAADSDDAAITAELRDVGDVLLIVLRSRDGKLTAERELPRADSCADLAAAAAVVIEAWKSEMHADVAVEIPTPRPPAPEAAPVPAATAIASEPTAIVPGAPSRWDVGIGGAASLQGDFAPAVLIDGHRGWAGSNLAARLALAGTAVHARSLGAAPGEARWSRAALGLGIRDRLWNRGVVIDAHADAQVALIHLDGAGFTNNYTRNGFDLGVGGGLRLAWKPDAPGVVVAAPFLGLEGVAWPREKTVVVLTPGMSAGQGTLPWFELRAVAGVSFGRF